MTKDQAKAAIADIAEDVAERRGAINADQVKAWGRAYTQWRDACAMLTTGELDDAIYDGLAKHSANES